MLNKLINYFYRQLALFHSLQLGKSIHQKWKAVTLIVLSPVLFSACICPFCFDIDDEDIDDYKQLYYDPVYLSYRDLREAIKVETTDRVYKTGKIYLYQDYLFVNEPNHGIHVYNNSDPSQPKFRYFINIPGNLDIAVREGFLYADSYIDLVVLNVNDPDNIYANHRIEDVFPYNPYQNVPTNIPLYYDETKGVVIGYKEVWR